MVPGTEILAFHTACAICIIVLLSVVDFLAVLVRLYRRGVVPRTIFYRAVAIYLLLLAFDATVVYFHMATNCHGYFLLSTCFTYFFIIAFCLYDKKCYPGTFLLPVGITLFAAGVCIAIEYYQNNYGRLKIHPEERRVVAVL